MTQRYQVEGVGRRSGKGYDGGRFYTEIMAREVADDANRPLRSSRPRPVFFYVVDLGE